MLNYAATQKATKSDITPQWINPEEVDLSLLNNLLQENKELGPDKVLNDIKYNPLLNPFEMKWTFGFDITVPVLNLSSDTTRQIFYSATNVGILYDYCSKKMTHLRGHESKIISVSVDKTGRWLATADNGSENAIMIWDIKTSAVVWTIFNHPPPGYDLVLIRLSLSAKLLITITNQNQTTIHFWLWTYGNQEANDSYNDERDLGTPKAIKFHPSREEFFMVIFEKSVLFFLWDYNQRKVLKVACPKSPISTVIGQNSCGSYIEYCHEAFVGTTKGYILVFGNTIFSKTFVAEELDNDKFYVKGIKVSKYAIQCMATVDELLVTGDSSGTIMFFDKRIKLLYWFAKQISKPIKSISFNLNPRKYKFVQEMQDDLNDGLTNNCIIDLTQEYEKIVQEQMPKDATLQKKPFVTRDFFITTSDGTIYLMNFAKQDCLALFPTADSTVAAIDVHDEKPYLLIAYAKGRLALYNYETHQEVVTAILPDTEADALITDIKYSNQCLHLACGRSNGELWLLNPAALGQIYVDPFKFGGDKIVKIVFSENSLQMAYYDSNMTVYAFYYDVDSEDWIFKGKVRSHYKEICNILFVHEEHHCLYTIGKDRHIIKYTDISTSEEELDCLTRDRIEQKDIPVYFTTYPRKQFSKGGYFLVADDKHKYKTISSKTAMCTGVYLGPAYGCFKNNPVCKMEVLPGSNKTYLIFMSKKQIGIQLMPIDGNPFKYTGCLAHPEELLDFKTSYDGRYVFTTGKNDRTVFMWQVKTASVETMHLIGGLELQPFYCLIEGGRGGFLYQEMRDLFYYMQILQQGEQICVPRQVSDSINLAELPDLMRACGYYPSEYEIENLLTDLRYKIFDDTGILKDKVTFCEFVKLFINHKPAYGYSIENLESAFETMTTFTDEYGGSDMPRDDFIEAIETTGEQISNEQIYRCLATLLHEEVTPEQGGVERDFEFMYDTIDFTYLTEDILGLDMDSIERVSKEESEAGDYYSYYYSHR